jgi:hypothetical protein
MSPCSRLFLAAFTCLSWFLAGFFLHRRSGAKLGDGTHAPCHSAPPPTRLDRLVCPRLPSPRDKYEHAVDCTWKSGSENDSLQMALLFVVPFFIVPFRTVRRRPAWVQHGRLNGEMTAGKASFFHGIDADRQSMFLRLKFSLSCDECISSNRSAVCFCGFANSTPLKPQSYVAPFACLASCRWHLHRPSHKPAFTPAHASSHAKLSDIVPALRTGPSVRSSHLDVDY